MIYFNEKSLSVHVNTLPPFCGILVLKGMEEHEII